MAKGAIVSLTMDMAAQLAQYGIRTNCIAPGITGSQVGGQIAFEDRSAANLVGGRAGYPEEQASVALFLASDDSRHLYGQTLRERRRSLTHLASSTIYIDASSLGSP